MGCVGDVGYVGHRMFLLSLFLRGSFFYVSQSIYVGVGIGDIAPKRLNMRLKVNIASYFCC